jgi:hypothetical protein
MGREKDRKLRRRRRRQRKLRKLKKQLNDAKDLREKQRIIGKIKRISVYPVDEERLLRNTNID